MNEIIESLYRRKSVRAYEEREVAPEVKAAILGAAFQAATAGNQMLYTIIDITDAALKAKLAETCDHQPFIAKAPLVFIFCADCQKWLDAYQEAGCQARKPGVGDLLLAVEDACIAAQNAVTAAESLGLGSCYIGDIMEHCEGHRRLLCLPDYVYPAAMLVMGYPTQQQKDRIKPRRFDADYMVHENAYQRMDGKTLREMFEGHTDKRSFDDFMGAFCQRKYCSDFSREMTRSMELYLKEFERE